MEWKMADYGGSGDIRLLYGAVVRDRCKVADLDTLLAYRTVLSDLMHVATGDAATDLQGALADLENAIHAKR
jgi:hypothetical protein